MKALSIRQPWAWLIVNGYKDVENRTWDCPSTFTLPQRIYVHTGAALVEKQAIADVLRVLNFEQSETFMLGLGEMVFGAIVGEVTVNAWTDGWAAGSPWFEGPYGLILCNPIAYTKPIPYKGRLRLFEVKYCPQCGGLGSYQMFDRPEAGFARMCSPCDGSGVASHSKPIEQSEG